MSKKQPKKEIDYLLYLKQNGDDVRLEYKDIDKLTEPEPELRLTQTKYPDEVKKILRWLLQSYDLKAPKGIYSHEEIQDMLLTVPSLFPTALSTLGVQRFFYVESLTTGKQPLRDLMQKLFDDPVAAENIKEIWKPIPKHLGAFHWKRAEASSLGRIRWLWASKSYRRPGSRYRFYNTHVNAGSLCICDNTNQHFRVRVAVMEAFVGPKPEGLEIIHLNGNKLDCRLENLTYGVADKPRTHLTEADKDRIRLQWESDQRHRAGTTLESMASRWNVSTRTISRVLRNVTK